MTKAKANFFQFVVNLFSIILKRGEVQLSFIKHGFNIITEILAVYNNLLHVYVSFHTTSVFAHISNMNI